MLGTFSLDPRSMAEFRRIIMVLVCGNMSACWVVLMLCWFKLSRVSVDDDDDEDGDSSGNTFMWFQLSKAPELCANCCCCWTFPNE